MTPDSPDEALHFRGKTLTPESPRPLHIAEPANIPVLQNQMDPVFNDTSTYEKSVRISEDIYHVHHNGLLSSHGPYTGSGGAGGNAGSIQGSELQPPSQHHSHIQDPISLLAHPVPGLPPSSFSHRPHDIPFAHEVDHQAAPQSRLDPEAKPDDNSAEGDVDFQNLLDNLPPSTAPSAPTVSGTAHLSTEDPSATPQAGLPPRPPPQEKPSIHPNYNPSDDIRSYHQLPAHTTPDASNPYTTQQSSYQSNAALPPLAAAGAPGTSSGTSALPPPPIASFQQPPSAAAESQEAAPSVAQKAGRVERPPRIAKPGVPDEDAPWGPEVQKKYDEFLHDERVYVTEGLWDRFPYGSRLFVGNLPTERVTKRDLFHIFHNYGKLAQISIKQAYGFIQFLDASACKKALDSEQGAVVRGRKVHLEISKPQRNTRPAPATSESSRAPPPRRSRSPEYSRGGPPSGRNARASGDRYERPYEQGRVPFSDFRGEPAHRRRDDYRPPLRSPSPRGYRPREGYRSRDRTPERFDRRERQRSRSPYRRDTRDGRERRYRTPSPRGRGVYDSDADMPVPRRAARDVPDVQILVLEELDRNFIYHVETSFRNRGLRVDVLALGPRIPLDAAVQRQISEGVLAVVRLSRPSQLSRKIPLQVFDRSAAVDNVRSNEYPELDPNIAAEIVFQAYSLQRNGLHTSFPPTAYGVPALPSATMPHTQAPPPLASQPNLANLISTLDAPTLQSLLSALQQRPPVQVAQHPFPATNHPHAAPDLASLLSSATRQPILTNPQQSFSSQPFPLQAPNVPAVSDPNLLSLLAKGLGAQQPQNQAGVPPHVQNIMSQLGKWKQ